MVDKVDWTTVLVAGLAASLAALVALIGVHRTDRLERQRETERTRRDLYAHLMAQLERARDLKAPDPPPNPHQLNGDEWRGYEDSLRQHGQQLFRPYECSTGVAQQAERPAL